MRAIKDKGIAKLYAAAVRSRKNGKGKKHPKRVGRKAKRHSRPQARRKLTARGKAKAAHVMREFYHGALSAHGHRVARPDVAKAIAMSEGRAVSKPKRRRRRKPAKRRVDSRALTRAGRKAPRKRTEHERTMLSHASSRSWASGRMAKRVKKARKSAKKPTAKQLAARKKFVAMVRARAAQARKKTTRRSR